MSSQTFKSMKRKFRGQQRLKEALELLGWKALRVGNTDLGLFIGTGVYCGFVDALLEAAAQKVVAPTAASKQEEEDAKEKAIPASENV